MITEGLETSSYMHHFQWEFISGGKRYGTSGHNIGNVHLKWAFSEAGALFLVDNPQGQKYSRPLRKNMAQVRP